MEFSEQQFKHYKNYWEKSDNPQHAFGSEFWVERYFNEICFHVANRGGVMIDAGCGNGDFLLRFAPFYQQIIGIDYSQKMIDATTKRLHEKSIYNATLHTGSITDIDKFVGNIKADAIIASGVVQYLSSIQLNEFVSNAKKILNSKGEILLAFVPNYNLKELYNVGFYKQASKVSFAALAKQVFNFKYTLWKEKVKNKKYQYDDGIGNWFSFEDIQNIAFENTFVADFFYSIYPPYGYRFHARLTQK